MPPDHTAHQTFVTKVIETAVTTVTLISCVDQREVAQLVGDRNCRITFREVERLDCQGDFLGEADADKATCGNRVAVSNEARGFLCA